MSNMIGWKKEDRTDNTLVISGKPKKEKEGKGSKKCKKSRKCRRHRKKSPRSARIREQQLERQQFLRDIGGELSEGMEMELRKIAEMNRMIRAELDLPPKYSSYLSDSSSVDTREKEEFTLKTISTSGRLTPMPYRKKKKPRKSLDEQRDHNGLPLSHPLAITPFPGKASAEQRARARDLIRKLGARRAADAEKSSHKTVSTVSVDGKKEMLETPKFEVQFPNKCDPETRVRARKILKDMASGSRSGSTRSTTKKKKKSAKKVEKKVEKEKSDVEVKKPVIRYSPIEGLDNRRRCSQCATCQCCAEKCARRHRPKPTVVTEEDKKKFNKDIDNLREKLRNPEKSRNLSHEPTEKKQAYDLTQSISDHELSSTSQESKDESESK